MSEEEAQVFRGGHAVETAINEHSARKKKKPVTGPKLDAVSLQDQKDGPGGTRSLQDSRDGPSISNAIRDAEGP